MASDRTELLELKYRYCYATDNADVEALLDVFTENGYFDIGIYGTGSGHDDLREYMEWFAENKPGIRAHNVVNPIIDIDGDRATGKWYYFVLYETPDGQLEMGHGYYDDEYRRVDGTWKTSSLVAKRRASWSL